MNDDDRGSGSDWPWYFNATLFGLLVILSLVVVAAGPKP